MRTLVVGDIHYAQATSIVRKRGKKYSSRLENLITSINWVENTALSTNVDKIIYLGDFFDRADLNAEELTAFKEIKWSKEIPHIFIVGNHEIASHNLEYSSAHLIRSLGENFTIVDKPLMEVGFGYKFMYLPYIFENDRKPLMQYVEDEGSKYSGFVQTQELKRLYIFSHNDIKGVQYGMFESKSGFDKDEILDAHCRYFINGHIHNQGWIVKDRILNLGNLTGQNFNENGWIYPHTVLFMDTQGDNFDLIENPYALNFVKAEINTKKDISNLTIVPHMVLSIKCKEYLVKELRDFLDNCKDVEEYKVISTFDSTDEDTVNEDNVKLFTSEDHLQQFQSYIINQLGNTDIILKELQEVVK